MSKWNDSLGHFNNVLIGFEYTTVTKQSFMFLIEWNFNLEKYLNISLIKNILCIPI